MIKKTCLLLGMGALYMSTYGSNMITTGEDDNFVWYEEFRCAITSIRCVKNKKTGVVEGFRNNQSGKLFSLVMKNPKEKYKLLKCLYIEQQQEK